MSDLWFDPDLLGEELVVECRISDGPRRDDPSFDPRPTDEVLIDDGAGEPLRAVVLRRDGDRVRVRLSQHDPALLAYLRAALLVPFRDGDPPCRRRPPGSRDRHHR